MYFTDFNKSYINGEWVAGVGSDYQLTNPYDDRVISEFKLATKEQVNQAFMTAQTAQKAWAENPEARKVVLEKVRIFFEKNREMIIEMLAEESGATYVKSELELHVIQECLLASLDYVDKLGFTDIVSPTDELVKRYYRKPKGVIVSITPFNFPLTLAMRTIAPALALGNTIVHKGDVQTAFTGGVIIAKAFEEAGAPAGVFNMLLSAPSEIGDMLFEHPLANFVSFTGSTKVGKHIGSVAGAHLKPVALELGGNSPFVVLADADVDAAVHAAIVGKFLHQGQICMSVNRIIVHEMLYEAFKAKFVERAKALKWGDPMDRDTIIGPIINGQQLAKIKQMIADAKSSGTHIALEGRKEGNILTPTIFSEVDNASTLAQSEIFGPVALLIKAVSDEAAIAMANQTTYGLSSAIFTSDLIRGEALAADLEFGMTHVNNQTVNVDEFAPFGGMKQSGLGRFGTPFIIDELTDLKWVTVQRATQKNLF